MDDSTQRKLGVLKKGVVFTALPLFVVGCAATSVLIVENQEDDPHLFASTQTTPNDETSKIQLRVVEARPRGLLLHIQSKTPAAPGSVLKLLKKRRGDDVSVPFFDLELNDKHSERLAVRGLRVFDANLRKDGIYTYGALLETKESKNTKRSRPISWSWTAPPPAPGALKAHTRVRGAVELRWTPLSGWGVIIFRRDLTAGSKKIKRLGQALEVSGGVFFDQTIQAGGVYAYRLAFTRMVDGVPVFGRPSTEVFVTIPEE